MPLGMGYYANGRKSGNDFNTQTNIRKGQAPSVTNTGFQRPGASPGADIRRGAGQRARSTSGAGGPIGMTPLGAPKVRTGGRVTGMQGIRDLPGFMRPRIR